jgi:hypothetical protein
MVLTSAFARATGELAHSQIAAQLTAVPGGEVFLASYDTAMKEFTAGRPVPIDQNLPAGLQQMIQAITQPMNQPFAHELWMYNPIEKLADVKVPVLIAIGKKDIQVDWQADGSIFEAAAKEQKNVTLSFFENANHVLKFEPRPRVQLTAAEVAATYSAEDGILDPEVVNAILSWLKAQL